MLLRCLNLQESQQVIDKLHEGLCGRHFSPLVTTHKVINDDYYWPKLFKYSYAIIIKNVFLVKNSQER